MPGQIPYTIKVSRRARHVSLRLTTEEGLLVVVPVGFDPRRVPAIVNEKADWIIRTQRKMARQRVPGKPELNQPLPDRIELMSTGETWQVEYVRSAARGITLTQPARGRIRLTGAVGSRVLCQAALRRWANRRAKAILPPLLQQLTSTLGFDVNGVSIRNQRTRWGSCSRARAISLNQKLIFLPPELVRYVMLHELCHTQIMSHSAKFWDLVERYEPGYRERIKQLRSASHSMPVWA